MKFIVRSIYLALVTILYYADIDFEYPFSFLNLTNTL